MKKFLTIILLLYNLSLYSQNRIINKEDIVGRWIEESDSTQTETNIHTYIFRENMTFHLGEVHDGIIIFGIAGRYTIDSNVISVVYYDLINGNSKDRKAHRVSYEIISLENERMILLAKDNDYDYRISLRKHLR
ncbi:MAG: hypothetical protein ACK5M3_11355 [Dysgonomonas sp.]